jgi:hypothetical protein
LTFVSPRKKGKEGVLKFFFFFFEKTGKSTKNRHSKHTREYNKLLKQNMMLARPPLMMHLSSSSLSSSLAAKEQQRQQHRRVFVVAKAAKKVVVSSSSLLLRENSLQFSTPSDSDSSSSLMTTTASSSSSSNNNNRNAGKRGASLKARASVDNAESIARKVSRTAAACKTLGRWGFWGQLILFTVAAVVVVFSFLFKGFTKATDAGLYFILFGIMAGFFTTFWSLGLVRLGDRLKASIADLELVPPRAEVVKALTTGLTVNLVGLGATIVGLQATTGLLFAKTLTIAATGPFAQNANPVLALDIFLVQAASNAMLAHWLGMSISLWLLRTVNLPSPPAPKGEK